MSLDFVRNGVFMAIIAHGLIGLSLVWDKILLRRPATQNVVSYVFWMGAISIFGVVLAAFGFHMPPLSVALLAFGAGALQLAAIFFYYLALKRGEASEALAVMGGFSPLATALISAALLAKPMSRGDYLGFALTTLGGFVMFFTERFEMRKLLPPALIASGLYGVVNVVQKMAFNQTNFVTGYVFFTLGTFAGSLLLLVRRSWREQIFETSEEATPSSRFWYFVNRFISGVGSFLIFYAISLASPAIVDAISGLRYALVFIAAFVLTKWRPDWIREDFRGLALAGKLAGTLLVTAGLVQLGLQERKPDAVRYTARLERQRAPFPFIHPRETRRNYSLRC